MHDYANFNWVMTGSDVFACEGTSCGDDRYPWLGADGRHPSAPPPWFEPAKGFASSVWPARPSPGRQA